jgi:hypothetical protein
VVEARDNLSFKIGARPAPLDETYVQTPRCTAASKLSAVFPSVMFPAAKPASGLKWTFDAKDGVKRALPLGPDIVCEGIHAEQIAAFLGRVCAVAGGDLNGNTQIDCNTIR